MSDYNFTLLGFTVTLTIILFFRTISLRKRLAIQSNLLKIQNKSLESIQEKLENINANDNRQQRFLNDLQQASVTTDLQRPRSAFLNRTRKVQPPERYQYLRSMFVAGMEIEEMEMALGMSRYEIQQIQNLSNLGKTGIKADTSFQQDTTE